MNKLDDIRVDIVSGIGLMYPNSLNGEFSSKFTKSYTDRKYPDEDRSSQQVKPFDNSNKTDANCLHANNGKITTSHPRKLNRNKMLIFQCIKITFEKYVPPIIFL